MSIALIGFLTWLMLGLSVAWYLYPRADHGAAIPLPRRVAVDPAMRLRSCIRRWLAGSVIVLAWPLFIAAELASRRRYRMAIFIDDERIAE